MEYAGIILKSKRKDDIYLYLPVCDKNSLWKNTQEINQGDYLERSGGK